MLLWYTFYNTHTHTQYDINTRQSFTYQVPSVLQAFSTHENVIKLLNVIKADNNYDIYLVFEFMGE